MMQAGQTEMRTGVGTGLARDACRERLARVLREGRQRVEGQVGLSRVGRLSVEYSRRRLEVGK